MLLSGKYVKKNKKEQFLVNSNGIIINCQGNVLGIDKGTPIKMDGEFKDEIFIVSSFSLDILERENFIKFYGGRKFKFINKQKAVIIYEKLTNYAIDNGIVTTEIPAEIIEKLLLQEDIDENALTSFISNFCRIESSKNLINLLNQYKFNMDEIERTYVSLGTVAYIKILKNPYILLELNIPFYKCDKIAFNNGILKYDKKRINGIMQVVVNSIFKSGSTCVSLKKYKEILSNIQKFSPYKQIPFSYFASKILIGKSLVIDSDLNVFPWKSFKIEKNITREIKRLQSTNYEYQYEEKEFDYLDEDQIKVLQFLKKSGVYILTGGPGTGKTTTIKTIIQEYLEMTDGVGYFKLCAPTGRASVRITESSGYPAFTIHKLLNVTLQDDDDKASLNVSFNKMNQLPKGLFIIDEMSMVDEELFLMLLESIPSGSILILSGDPRQLPSVNPGKVLIDLINCKKIDTVHLTKNHRQKSNDLIVKNYYKIIDYNPILETNNNFTIDRFETKEEALEKVKYFYSKYKKEPIFDFQILSFTKKGILGTMYINDLIAKNRKSEMNGFSVGDKVITTVNNYTNGYFNGNIGKISGFSEENNIFVDFNQETIEIENQNIFDIDFAWAITTHKSQGSEHKTVVIIIDNEIDCMLYNSIILTAITRATEKVHIITIDDALEKSITTQNKIERTTGLSKFLSDNLN